MTKNTATRRPPRHDGDPQEFAAIVWRATDKTPTKLFSATAVDALTTAVEYLKAGYQVRLSDKCVAYFADLPRPDPVFSDAATSNGQAAALTGPPRIKDGK
jgi:hypothetical protein